MSEPASTDAEFPLRGKKLPHPFLPIGNELFDLYVPIMGADCFAVYAYFARRRHSDPTLKHDIRSVAQSCDMSGSTVSRALEVLEHLQLINLTRFGGSRHSECQLSDSWTIATRLGATFDSNSRSYRFPVQVLERLKAEVCTIREVQQGKANRTTRKPGASSGGNLRLSASQRHASVSPETRQRSTRETQTGTHLIQKEERSKRTTSLYPPSHGGETRTEKTDPDEDEPDEPLKCARRAFIGVMDEMSAHLLDTGKPQSPPFANGYADWDKFGFNNFAIVAALRSGEALVLILSASDVAAARRGLEKYHRKWEASLRKWYECEVHVEWKQAKQNPWELDSPNRNGCEAGGGQNLQSPCGADRHGNQVFTSTKLGKMRNFAENCDLSDPIGEGGAMGRNRSSDTLQPISEIARLLFAPHASRTGG